MLLQKSLLLQRVQKTTRKYRSSNPYVSFHCKQFPRPGWLDQSILHTWKSSVMKNKTTNYDLQDNQDPMLQR
eukprot:06058.XXX_350135_350350_1 [CDS] Oithona nana genome sequencing.